MRILPFCSFILAALRLTHAQNNNDNNNDNENENESENDSSTITSTVPLSCATGSAQSYAPRPHPISPPDWQIPI
jgi:hypothetical protein